MSDLSNAPTPADVEQYGDEDAEVTLIALAVDLLSDELDHPDIWGVLADMPVEDVMPVLVSVADLRAKQFDPAIVKILNILEAVLMATAVDHAAGLSMLKQLEAEHVLCPQVAGAYYFCERFGDPAQSSDLSTKFCDAPFVKFETLMDGHVAPCCSIWTKKRLGHLERQSFDEIWNSSDAIEMRESILDGSYRFCNKRRCTSIMEDTLPERDAVTDPDMRRIIDQDRTVLENGPKWLFLAHDVTCNLTCPSCRDTLLVADAAQEARFAKIEEQVFFPLLHADGRVTISVSGQGDPWSSQHYRSILRYMADHDLNAGLNIHTNALLMGEKRWADYVGLEKYTPPRRYFDRCLYALGLRGCPPPRQMGEAGAKPTFHRRQAPCRHLSRTPSQRYDPTRQLSRNARAGGFRRDAGRRHDAALHDAEYRVPHRGAICAR